MTRIFLIVNDGKQFRSEKPIDAAKKSAEYLLKKSAFSQVTNISFSLKEIAKNKLHHYSAKRNHKTIQVTKHHSTGSIGGTPSVPVPSLRYLAYQNIPRSLKVNTDIEETIFDSYVQILEEEPKEKERIHSILQKILDIQALDKPHHITDNYQDKKNTIFKGIWNIVQDYLNKTIKKPFDVQYTNNKAYIMKKNKHFVTIQLVKTKIQDKSISYDIVASYNLEAFNDIDATKYEIMASIDNLQSRNTYNAIYNAGFQAYWQINDFLRIILKDQGFTYITHNQYDQEEYDYNDVKNRYISTIYTYQKNDTKWNVEVYFNVSSNWINISIIRNR